MRLMKILLWSQSCASGWRYSRVRAVRPFLWTMVWLMSGLMGPWVCQAAPFQTEHVTAELVAEHNAVQPGQTLRVGLRLMHQPHWHTYWRNPGDAGLATTVKWTLPAAVQVGDIQWPAPRRLPVGPLVNYGYEGELLLPQTLTVSPQLPPGSQLTLQAEAHWLVCNEVCIPESASLTLNLPVVGAAVTPSASVHQSLFTRMAHSQPQALVGWTTRLQRAGQDALLTLDAPASPDAPTSAPSEDWPAVQVFPDAEQLLVPADHTVYRTRHGYAVKLKFMAGADVPAQLSGVVVTQGDDPPPVAWAPQARQAGEFKASVETVARLQWPEGAREITDGASVSPPEPLHQGGTASSTATQWSGWVSLALAFLGGALLNLMPCVFPVLSIKLLSALQQAQTPRAQRQHAVAYSLGVVGSFLGLAGLLLVLRSAGQAVGWGFQLQEPWVVWALALLFFAMGLNLLGVFEWQSGLPSAWASWRARRPSMDAAASGALAVIAASPCTAPFMGAALGFAVTQSTAMALAVFGSLGLGMAAPYALLMLLPGWRDRLPRPGPWMLHLKQVLALPMFFTVVWLLWVLGQQVGVDGMAWTVLCLVTLGFAIGLYGVARPSASRSRWLWGGVLLLCLWANITTWPASWSLKTAPSEGAGPSTSTEKIVWQPYDPDQVDRFLSHGEAVFIDFTAAWCVSCQVNKRLVLNTAATQAAFAQAKVNLMRADWTNRDPQITQALAKLGRNGVPVYVLMRPGKAPLLLPELLTFNTVQEALATLPR